MATNHQQQRVLNLDPSVLTESSTDTPPSPNNRAKTPSGGANTGDVHIAMSSNVSTDIRLSQLVKIISERGTNGVERVESLGGVVGITKSLHSDVHAGLTTEKVKRNRNCYGANFVPPPRSKTLLELMWDAAQDATLVILIIAGVISLILGLTIEEDKSVGWIEGVAIIITVFIVVLVTAFNDLQKERQFKALQAKQEEEKKVTVMRDGTQQFANIGDLVCGDIVLLTQGAIIPADGLVIDSSELSTDESTLTGEAREIRKGPSDPFLLSSTSVKLGTCTYVVTGVGLFSEEGIIKKIITGVGKAETRHLEEQEALMFHDNAKAIEEDETVLHQKVLAVEEKEKKDKDSPAGRKKESALQAKLTRMALFIGYVGTAVALVTVIALIIRYYASVFSGYTSEMWSDLLSFLIVGITVLVVAVPEGLPLAVTISLAYSVKKMMADHNLVRVLAACETMGNATTICSDKTGTLTKNKMTVVRSYMGGRDFHDLTEIPTVVSEDLRNRIAQHIALNSSAEANYTISPSTNLPIQDGNKTECAILYFADGICSRKYGDIRSDPASRSRKTFPFDSAKKRMTTVLPLPNGRYRVFVKGAAEIILGYCTARENLDGSVVPMSQAEKDTLHKTIITSYAEEALRVIAMTFKDINEPPGDDEDALVNNLVLTCFVGIQDPVRDEVPAAVLACQSAGVTVCMLTGDNMETARAIAYNCSILRRGQPLEEYTVMEGPSFRALIVNPDGSLNYKALVPICLQLRVMGRCSPTDKYNLVRALKYFGQTVAVTGDGTNDGPALSEANVGFAMGITGTGVAKEASDIIITDDNFRSIVTAISWGRNVYDSIAKFLVFQLTVNVVAITVAFIGACTLNESPLKAVQMLWVNLIMDSLASLALATEPPTPELLTRKPYDRSQPLMTAIMTRQILGHSLIQLAVCFVLVYAGDSIFNIPSGRELPLHASATQHYTIVFNAFVLMQLFNEINARKIHNELNVFKGILNNYIFCVVLGTTLVLQVIIVEFGGYAFRTTSLRWDQWIACVIIGLGSLAWNVVLHFIPPSIFPAKWFAAKRKKTLEELAAAVAIEQAQPPTTEETQLAVAIDEETESLRERVDTMPLESARRMHGYRPAADLWGLTKRNVMRSLSVASAFRSAGQRMRNRRLTLRDVAESDLPEIARSHTISGEAPERMTETNIDMSGLQPSHKLQPMVNGGSGSTTNGGQHTDSVGKHPNRWRSVIMRLRHQIRVVSAFRDGVIRHLNPSLQTGDRLPVTYTANQLVQMAGDSQIALNPTGASAGTGAGAQHQQPQQQQQQQQPPNNEEGPDSVGVNSLSSTTAV